MKLKRFFTVLIASPLLLIVFFSFAVALHESEGRMGGCPFSALETSPCPQNAIAVALHHLSAYQSLLSIPADSGTGTLLATLLSILSAALLFSIRPPLFEPPAFAGYVHNPPSPALPGRKVLRWLSLFENSPSFA